MVSVRVRTPPGQKPCCSSGFDIEQLVAVAVGDGRCSVVDAAVAANGVVVRDIDSAAAAAHSHS